jgi:hypothetical protein
MKLFALSDVHASWGRVGLCIHCTGREMHGFADGAAEVWHAVISYISISELHSSGFELPALQWQRCVQSVAIAGLGG